MGTHPIFESDFDCLSNRKESMSSHTILLVQPTRKPEGRTYSDYESVNDCMEGVCKIYEEHLKRLNPSSPQITYDISQTCLAWSTRKSRRLIFPTIKTGSKKKS